jgi:phosphotransacetylase
VNIFISFDL